MRTKPVHLFLAGLFLVLTPPAPDLSLAAQPKAASKAKAKPSRAKLSAAKPKVSRPAQYRWFENGPIEGPVEIVISLGQQRAWVFRDGELIGMSKVSSGKPGDDSPYGRFQILEKKRMHRSIRYDNAPMPHMQRLNWHGVALHGGHVPDYPASHGCIRFPVAFAAKLFQITDVGTYVFVTHDEPQTPDEALELARANADAAMPEDRLPQGVYASR